MFATVFKMQLIRKSQILNVLNYAQSRWLSTSVQRTTKFQWSYVCAPGSIPLSPLTMGQLVDRSADLYHDRQAVASVHQNIRKTFAEVKIDVDNLAAGFLSLGLEPGDRIGIWGPNSYEWYLTQFAAGKAGLVLVNINPAYQPDELKFCLKKVGVKALVSAETFKSQDYYTMLHEIMPEMSEAGPGAEFKSGEVPSMRRLIMMSEKDLGGSLRFREVMEVGGSSDHKKIHELDRKIQFDDPCNIQFTSGTTGKPKGACLTHHGIINNARFVGYRAGYDKKHHKCCVQVPLYHCFGCVLGTLTMMYHGGTCVLPSYSFNPVASLQAIESERCTSLYGTPTMFVDILEQQRMNKLDLSSLETGIMAGSLCPTELCRSVINELNMKDFIVGYGSTETSPISMLNFPADDIKLKTSTVGYPSDHLEVKIVDENNRIVPTGQPGELCVRGYSVMLGYWDDEEKTKETITEYGWFHSGDRAVMFEDGYGQIVGRIKDMVIRGGENLYPREIEELLHSHPDILEVYVVGVPDKRMGEELCAWLKVKDESKINKDDVKEFCKGKIAHFKIPRYIHFATEFPTTISGKVQKFRITEESIKMFNLSE